MTRTWSRGASFRSRLALRKLATQYPVLTVTGLHLKIQRDVRQLLDVSNLEAFTTFLRLCAGRSAQELVLSSLGADAGVSQPTARAWLSVLETSFLCQRLPPWHRNFRKQTVKAPKLHFLDSGLVCFLLGISSAEQLRTHPLRGAIFETWVASEIYKARANAGQTTRLSHYRQARGPEVDLLVEASRALLLVAPKSGATVGADFFAGLDGLAELIAKAEPHRSTERVLVYGGNESRKHRQVSVVPWSELPDVPWCD